MEDWRFQECPYLESGGLRAYAGVPLRIKTQAGDCVSLGSLCVASSTSKEPLSKSQHQTLVHLADWIISDLVQCTRVRRQRERHRMSNLLAKVQSNQNEACSVEPVLDILRDIYPDAIVGIRSSTSATHVELDENHSVPIADLQDGLYEDVEYLDDLIENFNHKPLPTKKPARILSATCESISGSSILFVASKDFHLVFDDVDSWFIQACADTISQMWHLNLLTEALKAKEKFMRAFSHQLRTPVHGILGSVELLAEEFRSRSLNHSTNQTSVTNSAFNSDGPFTYINTIKMAGHDLTSIINNLITLNKWVDIAMAERNYSKHTINELEEELQRGITDFIQGDARYSTSIFFVHNSSSPCVSFRTDLQVLQDAVLPLIINAIQNTRQGTVSVTTTIDTVQNRMIVDVEDTGCGIHPDFQQRIFEAYEKVDSHSPGAGLGLTLASKFASLLTGSVDLITSQVDRGSHFRAIFGVNGCDCTPTGPKRLPASMGQSSLPSKFFTIREDDSLMLRSFENFLVFNGLDRSDSLEDCIFILEAASDPEKYRQSLSLIPSEKVAICLVPTSRDLREVEKIDSNVICLTSPFTASALHLALEKACKHHVGRNSKPFLSETNALTCPPETILPVPKNLCIAMKAQSTTPRPLVLIVDDNALNVRVMETYCKKRKLPYLSAANGLEAFEKFSENKSRCNTDNEPGIELIFMDQQMPVCGGIEATQKIRQKEQQEGWGVSSIFFMTGQDSPADRKAASEAGADEYFVKPVGLKPLDRAISEYFPEFETA